MRTTVVILTKLPGFLPVKSRLVPVLGEAGARAAYLEMLRDTAAAARRLDARPVVAYSPPDADPHAALPDLGPCRFLPLRSTGGAACLEEALEQAFVGAPLVALGGDAPDLPATTLRQAADAAAQGQAALVPTGDGGFSCLALPRPAPGLASAFGYGSDRACDELAAFLAARRVAVALLPPWPDVDTPPQYLAWRARRADAPPLGGVARFPLPESAR